MKFNLMFPNFNFAHKYDEIPYINDEYADHFHMIYEILLFKKGRAEFIIENKKFDLNPGDLLFIPPAQHHHINIDLGLAYERYVLKFPEYAIPSQILSQIKK